MPNHRKARLFAACGLSAALLVSAFATTAFARSSTAKTVTPAVASQTPAAHAIQVLNKHTVNMSKVPQETAAQAKQAKAAGHQLPFLTPAGTKAYQQWQHSNRGAAAPSSAGLSPSPNILPLPDHPVVYNTFQGQSDSATTCPYFASFGGCEPPDMGLAANAAGLALQSVNTSLALYDVHGNLQPGWPKNAQNFFGVPNPTPAGCDSAGPFTSDPRSWYDPYQNRWGEAELQVEGGLGIAPGCTFTTLYWVAISQTIDPNGAWTVFAINMAFGSDPTAAADFTQFGFNGDGIYVSANMFGSGFYSEVVGCAKIPLYYGGTIKCNGYFNLKVSGPGGTVVVDTVNPVQMPLDTDHAPHSEFFVSSFNNPDIFGDDCVTKACHGATIWSWSDPGNVTGHGNIFVGAFVNTSKTYLEPPAADQPSCTGGHGCLDAGDNRVSSTPVYHAGHIYAAHVTGIKNAANQFVPGIQWWDFTPTLTIGYPSGITGVTEAQDAYLNGSNNFTAFTYPVMMTNTDNDVLLGYDSMGDTTFPSINVTQRRVTDPANVMSGGAGMVLVAGTVSTPNTRWGDFEAMSYTAPYQDFIWFASQYANPAAGGDWTTQIIRLRLDRWSGI